MPSHVPVRALAQDACECGGGERGTEEVRIVWRPGRDRRPLKLHWFVCSEQQKESAPHEKLGSGRSRRREKGRLGKSCAMLEDPRSQTTSTARISHVAGGQGRMRMLKKKRMDGRSEGLSQGRRSAAGTATAANARQHCQTLAVGNEAHEQRTSPSELTCSDWACGQRYFAFPNGEVRVQNAEARMQRSGPCSRLGNSSAAVQET
jgi:hypothetical protein